MKKIKQAAEEFEKKSPSEMFKISLMIFLVSFLIGFSSGLFFRQLRLNLLMAKQNAQKTAETRQMNTLLEEFSQAKSFPFLKK